MTEESFERGGALVFMIIDLLFHLVYLQCWEFIKPLLKFKQNYNKMSPHTRQNGHHQKVLDIITLLCLKWIANKDLLYSTWNFAQCYVAVWIGGEFGGEWIHVSMWLSPFTVHLKLTYHC